MISLGSIPDTWNDYAQRNEVRSHVEREWNRQLERALLPCLDATSLKCLVLIKGRTLGWQKYAEAIPMQHFLCGILDEEGEVRLGTDMRPYCSGTGIAKEDTVRAALKRLDQGGLITRIRGIRGYGTPVNVFMPFSQQWLSRKILEAGGGILPAHVPGHFHGEHVRTRDGRVWEIVGGRDHFIEIEEVTSPGRRSGESRSVVSPEISRLSYSDWQKFTGEKCK